MVDRIDHFEYGWWMVITWQNSSNWKVYPIERDLFPDPTHMRTIRVYLWLLGARPSAPQTQSKLKLSAFAPFKLDMLMFIQIPCYLPYYSINTPPTLADPIPHNASFVRLRQWCLYFQIPLFWLEWVFRIGFIVVIAPILEKSFCT